MFVQALKRFTCTPDIVTSENILFNFKTVMPEVCQVRLATGSLPEISDFFIIIYMM